MEKIEIELKLSLKNVESLKRRLDKIAIFLKEAFQRDTYFVPSHRNFVEQKPIYEWLRIREVDKRDKKVSILSYKNFGKGKKYDTISCNEFETEINDSEILKKIFKNLDIKELIIVNKKRRNYSYKNTIISVDSVEGLGDFIEVEFDVEGDNEEEVKKYLYSILEEIEAEVSAPLFKGYPHLLLEKQGYS